MHGLLRTTLSAICLAGTLLACVGRAETAQEAVKTPSSGSVPSALSDGSNLSAEMQGDLAMNRGSFAAAVDWYQKAWPRSAGLWNKTGLAYHHLFAIDEAMKDYQMALMLDPRFGDAYNNLGAAYHSKQMYGQAERAYKRAIKYGPHSAVAYCNLGTTYFAEAKYKPGAKAYRKAFTADPDVFKLNRRDRVESGATRAERMAIAYSMAKVYAAEGLTSDALDALHTALSFGFNDRKRLMNDPEFALLRVTPEFQKLMVEEHLN